MYGVVVVVYGNYVVFVVVGESLDGGVEVEVVVRV